MLERQIMIERLTGVQSSKRSYYTELKNTVAQLQKKNMQLEIIHEVMKNLNVEMSMDDMLKNIKAVASNLEMPGMSGFGSPSVLVEGLSVAGK